MSWKNVLVVRPQPGHAVTCGVKLRIPSDCRICWETMTSSVRSPLGSGVSEARMVSPIPSWSSTEIAATGDVAIDRDQVLHAANFRAEDDLVVRQAKAFGGFGRPDRTEHDRVARDFARVFGLGEAAVFVHHLG